MERPLNIVGFPRSSAFDEFRDEFRPGSEPIGTQIGDRIVVTDGPAFSARFRMVRSCRSVNCDEDAIPGDLYCRDCRGEIDAMADQQAYAARDRRPAELVLIALIVVFLAVFAAAQLGWLR